MNLRDLEYITAIAELGSFARAAEACHVSASTLSIQLAKLEAYLGVALFERSNRHVAPTPTGRAVIALAQDIVRQSQRLREVAREGQDPISGAFTLGVFPTLAPYYLPKAAPLLGKAFPKLRLRLVEEKSPVLLEKLKSHELDAALLALPIDGHEFAAAPLFDDPFYVACRRHHPLTARTYVQMRDLEGESLLLLEDGHCLRDQALEVCHTGKARENQEFRATSLETLRHMVASGAGITLMPRLACLPTPNLAYIPFDPASTPARHIGLVWRRTSPRRALMEAMTGVLREGTPISPAAVDPVSSGRP